MALAAAFVAGLAFSVLVGVSGQIPVSFDHGKKFICVLKSSTCNPTTKSAEMCCTVISTLDHLGCQGLFDPALLASH